MQNYNKDKICKILYYKKQNNLIDYKTAVSGRSVVINIFINSDDQQINTDKIKMNKSSIGIKK